MPTLAQSTDAPAPSPPSADGLQVARFRGALDWMVAHPAWEVALLCSLNELGFKGQRQGIGARNALRALPIEQKQELARHALEQGLPAPSYAEAKRFARLWGATQYRARSDFARPSSREWQALQQTALVRICARYERYKEAQSRLFTRYQQLAVEGALALCRNSAQREDACQEARLALLEAIDRIEPSENFPAYARSWIRRRVQNLLMQERVPVKAPVNLISKSLRGEPGANPALQQALREGTVQLDGGHCPQRLLDAHLSTDSADSPNQAAAEADDSALIAYALSHLTDKQRQVVELRFGLGDAAGGQSLAQIAQQTGISRQQVFQREKRALQALRGTLQPLDYERTPAPLAPSSY